MNRGFTLIELSVVLVIIGLIVGGIFVGQDLIRAAAARSQIAQIERYNTAANTFQEKYSGLPGDLNKVLAAKYNFIPRGSYAAEGDGNGVLQATWNPNNNDGACGVCIAAAGELMVFWVDLTAANMMDGAFNTATETTEINTNHFSPYFPPAKIGNGNYVYIWSNNSINYFGIVVLRWISGAGISEATIGMTVQQASAIDAKIDDGLPQSGSVTAVYVDFDNFGDPGAFGWAGTGTPTGGTRNGGITGSTPYTTATQGSSISCFDNSTSPDGQTAANGTPQHYSMEINNGAGVNCALSFKFQ